MYHDQLKMVFICWLKSWGSSTINNKKCWWHKRSFTYWLLTDKNAVCSLTKIWPSCFLPFVHEDTVPSLSALESGWCVSTLVTMVHALSHLQNGQILCLSFLSLSGNNSGFTFAMYLQPLQIWVPFCGSWSGLCLCCLLVFFFLIEILHLNYRIKFSSVLHPSLCHTFSALCTYIWFAFWSVPFPVLKVRDQS